MRARGGDTARGREARPGGGAEVRARLKAPMAMDYGGARLRCWQLAYGTAAGRWSRAQAVRSNEMRMKEDDALDPRDRVNDAASKMVTEQVLCDAVVTMMVHR